MDTKPEPELAARLLFDIVAAAVDDGDEGPLETFLETIANDPRIPNTEEARSMLVAIAGAVGPCLPHLYRRSEDSA